MVKRRPRDQVPDDGRPKPVPVSEVVLEAAMNLDEIGRSLWDLEQALVPGRSRRWSTASRLRTDDDWEAAEAEYWLAKYYKLRLEQGGLLSILGQKRLPMNVAAADARRLVTVSLIELEKRVCAELGGGLSPSDLTTPAPVPWHGPVCAAWVSPWQQDLAAGRLRGEMHRLSREIRRVRDRGYPSEAALLDRLERDRVSLRRHIVAAQRPTTAGCIHGSCVRIRTAGLVMPPDERIIRRLRGLLDRLPDVPGLAERVTAETRSLVRTVAAGVEQEMVTAIGSCPICGELTLHAYHDRDYVRCDNPGCRCDVADCGCHDPESPGLHRWARHQWGQLANYLNEQGSA